MLGLQNDSRVPVACTMKLIRHFTVLVPIGGVVRMQIQKSTVWEEKEFPIRRTKQQTRLMSRDVFIPLVGGTAQPIEIAISLSWTYSVCNLPALTKPSCIRPTDDLSAM